MNLANKSNTAKLPEIVKHFQTHKNNFSLESLRVARNNVKKFQNSTEKAQEENFFQMKRNIEAIAAIIESLTKEKNLLDKTTV